MVAFLAGAAGSLSLPAGSLAARLAPGGGVVSLTRFLVVSDSVFVFLFE